MRINCITCKLYDSVLSVNHANNNLCTWQNAFSMHYIHKLLIHHLSIGGWFKRMKLIEVKSLIWAQKGKLHTFFEWNKCLWFIGWNLYLMWSPVNCRHNVRHIRTIPFLPSDKLDKNSERMWLIKNFSQWNGHNHFRFALDFSYAFGIL
jgi:hypothetical protein